MMFSYKIKTNVRYSETRINDGTQPSTYKTRNYKVINKKAT